MTLQFAVPSIESAARGGLHSLPRVAAPTFLECVAAVAAERRREAQAELIDIAYWSRASQGAVSRFENHHSQPRNLDRLLLAYSKVCEIPAGELLREAVRRWEEGAGAGELNVPGGAPPLDEALARELEAAAQRDRRQRGSSAAAGRGRARRGRAS